MVHFPDGQNPAGGPQFLTPEEKDTCEMRLWRGLLNAAHGRMNEANRKLDDLGYPPVFMDQYPGKRVPYIYSRMFGPFGITWPRRQGSTGVEGLATVATPSQFSNPISGNIQTGTDGFFWWCRTSVSAYMSVTVSSAWDVTNTRKFSVFGGIFDSVNDSNGGALWIPINLNAFTSGTTQSQSEIDFDLELVDKKRGLSISDRHMSSQLFNGASFANKPLAEPVVFDPKTEIEPRLYLLKCAPKLITDSDISDTDFAAINVKAYINIQMIGYKELI